MSDDPTWFDPKKPPPPIPGDARAPQQGPFARPPAPAAPPPVPDAVAKTDPESPFAQPPKQQKAAFAPPPVEPSKYDWGRIEYGKMPIANGPPRILGLVCGGWILFTLFQLWVWLPEEILVPGCPAFMGILALILAVYTWSGRNWARLLAMVNAVAWAIGAVILARTPSYEHLAPGAKPLTIVRAAFELFAAYAVNRPDCVAYFELRKGYVPKF